MKQSFLILVITLGALGGCGESTAPIGDPGHYLLPTSPENLVENLQIAYRRQDIGAYADILAPEFRYEFQQADASEIGMEFWNRDQEVACKDAWFRSSLIYDIRIEFTYSEAEDPIGIGFDPGTKKIPIRHIFLEVDLTNGITWQVDADVIQDLFFRKGREAAGEDITRWFLFEWRDIPSGGEATTGSAGPDSTISTTWDGILDEFCNAP